MFRACGNEPMLMKSLDHLGLCYSTTSKYKMRLNYVYINERKSKGDRNDE
jgi:hypothetical protein